MGSKITFWKQMRGLLSTIPASAGTMPTARLGSGTADNTSYLRGDQTYVALATMKIDLGLTTKITIVGTSDVVQVDVRPFSGQTNRQQVWRNQAGVVVTSVDEQGRVIMGSGSWSLTSTFHATMWNAGAYGWASTGSVDATSTLETGFVRDGGAGRIGFRVGTTPHDLRIYNTYTNSTNYERGHIGYQSNVFTIGSYALGTGTLRSLALGVTGNSIGVFGATPIARPTTSHGTATFVANSGTAVNDASTFDGYTLRQVVKALRDFGVLT